MYETVDLLEVTDVVWPDASLGCPKPGKVYSQVTREGYVVSSESASIVTTAARIALRSSVRAERALTGARR